MSPLAETIVGLLREPAIRAEIAAIVAGSSSPTETTPASTEADRWISAAEAAGLLGIGKDSIYRRVKNGAIPRDCYTRAIGQLRFSKIALTTWMAGNEKE